MRLLSASVKRLKWPIRPGVANPAAKYYSNLGHRCRRTDDQNAMSFDNKLNISPSTQRPYTQPLPTREFAEHIRINTALPSRRQRLRTSQGCRSGTGESTTDLVIL